MKMVVQSSAIRAALLEAERDETDDLDKPMSRTELLNRAVVNANKPSSLVRAVTSVPKSIRFDFVVRV